MTSHFSCFLQTRRHCFLVSFSLFRNLFSIDAKEIEERGEKRNRENDFTKTCAIVVKLFNHLQNIVKIENGKFDGVGMYVCLRYCSASAQTFSRFSGIVGRRARSRSRADLF